MKKHNFIRKEDGDWYVVCTKTGGEFSTGMWRKGFTQQKCPCCGEMIMESVGK